MQAWFVPNTFGLNGEGPGLGRGSGDELASSFVFGVELFDEGIFEGEAEPFSRFGYFQVYRGGVDIGLGGLFPVFVFGKAIEVKALQGVAFFVGDEGLEARVFDFRTSGEGGNSIPFFEGIMEGEAGVELCQRGDEACEKPTDEAKEKAERKYGGGEPNEAGAGGSKADQFILGGKSTCLLYTSDAADE